MSSNNYSGIFSFCIGKVNPAPWAELINVIDQFFTTAAQCDKSYPLAVQFRQVGVAGKFRVKNKSGGSAAVNLFPKGEKIKHLIIGQVKNP